MIYFEVLVSKRKLKDQGLSPVLDALYGGPQPEEMDRLDVDSALKSYSEMVGAPGGILRSDEDVANLRTARMQMMMMQQQAAQAEAAKKEKADARKAEG